MSRAAFRTLAADDDEEISLLHGASKELSRQMLRTTIPASMSARQSWTRERQGLRDSSQTTELEQQQLLET